MKIVTILGSPRKQGNTARVLVEVERHLASRGHTLDRIDVADYNVRGCDECFACQGSVRTAKGPACVKKDDAKALLVRMIRCDAILVASPVFCWGFPGQLKPLLDRSFCLVTGYPADHFSVLEGQRLGLLLTCAGPLTHNADLVVSAFHRWAQYLKCKTVPELVVRFHNGDAQVDHETIEQARKLAEALTA